MNDGYTNNPYVILGIQTLDCGMHEMSNGGCEIGVENRRKI